MPNIRNMESDGEHTHRQTALKKAVSLQKGVNGGEGPPGGWGGTRAPGVTTKKQ